MSTRVDTMPRAPGLVWWVLMALVITLGMAIHWGIGAAVLVFILTQIARPLDFITSYLLVVTIAAFVLNEGLVGQMTIQLGRLTLGLLFMLACYVLAARSDVLSVPRVKIAKPLIAYLLLGLVNTFRGLQSGAPARNVGLEFIGILGISSAILVANQFDAKRDLRFATLALIVISFGPAIWGFSVLSQIHSHLIGFYSMAIPGMVGLLLLNLAMRATDWKWVVAWTTLSLPLFVHQFATFGRGLWTGCIAGFIFSVLVYTGFRRGNGARWRRVGWMAALVMGFGLIGILQAAVFLGQHDVLNQAVVRLGSIGSTKEGQETQSNVIRLFEYTKVLRYIRANPLFGYGIGFTFSVREPFSGVTADQWGVHQNYLLVWLKQGLIGLLVFLWMLWDAIVLSAREARRRTDIWESTWFAATGAATVFLATFSLSNYPFTRVNEVFYLAILWGGAMAMAKHGSVRLRWSPPAPEEEKEAA